MSDELNELHKAKQLIVALSESAKIMTGSLKVLEDWVDNKINSY